MTWEGSRGEPADYAVVWRPPVEMLRGRTDLKAVFNLGAGVDGILRLRDEAPDALPAGVPIVRLDDAGMAAQMAEYVTHAVLRYFRKLDAYAEQERAGNWKFLKPHRRADFTIGVMGVGTLGTHIARTLAGFGFPVRGWSRTARAIEGVSGFYGDAGQAPFLDGLRVLVNVLPLTPQTENILNAGLFARLSTRFGADDIANKGNFLAKAEAERVLDEDEVPGPLLDPRIHVLDDGTIPGSLRTRAFDDRTGEVLWEQILNSSAGGFPVTYMVDGVQYLAIAAGGGPTYRILTPEIRQRPGGNMLFVFRLP